MSDLEYATQGAGRHGAPSVPSSDESWKSTRERVRDIIRAEVERFHPTDDARYPLELIVESSVRFKETDGTPAITVVDDAGQPRTIMRDGQMSAFTIGDLLEEMRLARPMLFKSGQAPDAAAKVHATPEAHRRDWLDLGAGHESPPSANTKAPEPGHLLRLRRGRARLHLWTRTARHRWIEPALATGTAKLQSARADLPKSFDQIHGVFEKARTPSAARGLAVGAVAIAALIGIGSVLLSGRDRSAPTANAGSRIEGPATTGAVSSAPAASETAAIAPSTGGRVLRGVPDVIDTATLSLDGEVVRLFGVEWAPGGGKPDDLTQYLQGREVSCEQVKSGETYRCQVGGQDLSRVVLFNGGGKATAEATPELKSAEEKARTAQTGVWGRQP